MTSRAPLDGWRGLQATELVGLENIRRRLTAQSGESQSRRESFRISARDSLGSAALGCIFEANQFKPDMCKLCHRHKRDHGDAPADAATS
jgi:hypothetical protein